MIGVIDYYNSMTFNEDYLSAFPGILEFIRDMPLWAKAVWGVAIAGSILGSISLVLRKAWAVPIFGIAIIGMILSFGYQWTAPNKVDVPVWTHVFTAVIWLIAFFLFWFASKMKVKGVLR